MILLKYLMYYRIWNQELCNVNFKVIGIIYNICWSILNGCEHDMRSLMIHHTMDNAGRCTPVKSLIFVLFNIDKQVLNNGLSAARNRTFYIVKFRFSTSYDIVLWYYFNGLFLYQSIFSLQILMTFIIWNFCKMFLLWKVPHCDVFCDRVSFQRLKY